jgi:hypothetical protein
MQELPTPTCLGLTGLVVVVVVYGMQELKLDCLNIWMLPFLLDF